MASLDKYIILGGEKHLSPPITSNGIKKTEIEVFERWYGRLKSNEIEKENFIECPVNAEERMFIKAFWDEGSGVRPICYYVGVIVPKVLYIKIGDYYSLIHGLCSLSLESVLSAARKRESIMFPKIDVQYKKAFNLSYTELRHIRKIDIRNFSANVEEMCFLVSINKIDDWFGKLVVAVNPHHDDVGFNMLVSRKRPLPQEIDTPIALISANNKASIKHELDIQTEKKHNKYQKFFPVYLIALPFVIIITIVLTVSFCFAINKGNVELWRHMYAKEKERNAIIEKKYSELKEENQKLEKENKSLRENLSRKNILSESPE